MIKYYNGRDEDIIKFYKEVPHLFPDHGITITFLGFDGNELTFVIEQTTKTTTRAKATFTEEIYVRNKVSVNNKGTIIFNEVCYIVHGNKEIAYLEKKYQGVLLWFY